MLLVCVLWGGGHSDPIHVASVARLCAHVTACGFDAHEAGNLRALQHVRSNERLAALRQWDRGEEADGAGTTPKF